MGRAVRLPDQEGAEEHLQFPEARVVPVQLLTNQSVWEAPGVLRDQLRQVVGPAAVKLAEAFPCPFTLPLSGKKCNRKGKFYFGLKSWDLQLRQNDPYFQ